MTTVDDESTLRPLRLGKGLRILALRMVHIDGTFEDYDFSRSAVTILHGRRNSSKTTTFKVIDYCLGDDDGPLEALGSSIAGEYAEFTLTISTNGSVSEIRRIFERGFIGKIELDNSTWIPASELSEILLSRLAWPILRIPKAIDFRNATSDIPLSFRSLLRHIYRREDSWTDFASKEVEFLRRAVFSLFLGAARAKYDNPLWLHSQSERELHQAEAAARDIIASTDASARAVSAQLGLPPVQGVDGLPTSRAMLEARYNALELRHEMLQDRARASISESADSDPDLGQELERVSAIEQSVAEAAASLTTVLEQYRQSRALASSDKLRLERLQTATSIFEELPVRLCPACEQRVDPKRPHNRDECYLCAQPVTLDLRHRRIEIEQRSLDSEVADLDGAIEVAAVDLAKTEGRLRNLQDSRSRISRQLNDKRASQLAPFMAELEDLATQMGQVKTQMAALPALESIFRQRDDADQRVAAAAEVEAELAEAVRQHDSAESEIPGRCNEFARHMNQFLSQFGELGWVNQQISVDARTFAFYVGPVQWDQALGAEARVIFFLAYGYALIAMHGSVGNDLPGVVLLDNPFQQGLDDGVVVRALELIFEAADRRGAQVIVAQAKQVSSRLRNAAVLEMPNDYSAQANAD